MYSIIKSILSVLVSILLIRYFNIFQFVTIIPDEYSFEIYLTIHLSVSDYILSKIEEKIKKQFSGEVECVFYDSPDTLHIENNPSISFIEDVCFLNCSLTLKGSSSLFKDNSLIISLPNWVSVQSNDKSIVKTNNNNEFVIPLDGLIAKNTDTVEDVQGSIKLGFIREELTDNYSYTIVPKLKNKCRISYKHNKAHISNTNRR